MDTATTTAFSATATYALTAGAKLVGLPDNLVRAFAGFVSLALPIGIAWYTGTLHSIDWNNNLPALYDASTILLSTAMAYLAATGAHEHIKDATKR